MSSRWFHLAAGAILVFSSLLTLSLLELALGKALLLVVSTGVWRTQSILDVPRYAFVASIVAQIFILCAGCFLLLRGLARR
jgi:hypothetical protein